VTGFDLTEPSGVCTYIDTFLLDFLPHSKVPFMLTRIVAAPSEYVDWPAKRSHGRKVPPMPKLVVRPATSMRLPSREPLITMDGRGAAAGVTAFDAFEATDQPAPFNA
jgi:hypothetical protein